MLRIGDVYFFPFVEQAFDELPDGGESSFFETIVNNCEPQICLPWFMG